VRGKKKREEKKIHATSEEAIVDSKQDTCYSLPIPILESHLRVLVIF
jgi:hypothetical protein